MENFATPSPPRFDATLDAARRLEPAAIESICRAWQPRVYRYLVARVGDPTQAEDLMQDVLVAAIQGLPRFRGNTEGELLAWLVRIAERKVVDWLRRRYRRPEELVAEMPEVRAQGADPAEEAETRARRRALAGALDRLTPKQRAVAIARLVLDLNLAETAQLVGRGTGTVKALQHRALRRLARLLEQEGWNR